MLKFLIISIIVGIIFYLLTEYLVYYYDAGRAWLRIEQIVAYIVSFDFALLPYFKKDKTIMMLSITLSIFWMVKSIFDGEAYKYRVRTEKESKSNGNHDDDLSDEKKE